MNGELASLVVGEIDRSWTAKPHRLDGKPAIKISLKTSDANEARSRWASIHAQIEALHRLALIQVAYKRKRAIAEQVRHDILADDDNSWLNNQHLNGTAAAVLLAGGGMISASQAANFARDVETNVAHHALQTRDLGILETIRSEMDDPDAARAQLQRIGAAANQGLTPDSDDIAALDALSRTQVATGELNERLAENGITMPPANPDRKHVDLMMLRAKAQAHRDIETPPRPPILVEARPITAKASSTLSEMYDKWVEQKRPSTKTASHNKLYVQRFIAIYGDLPLANVSREQVCEFRDLIARFPRNVLPALEGASPHEVVAWADANPSVRRISRTTVNNRAIGALLPLFHTAKRDAIIHSNPCLDLGLGLKASDRKVVAPFTVDELTLSSPRPRLGAYHGTRRLVVVKQRAGSRSSGCSPVPEWKK